MLLSSSSSGYFSKFLTLTLQFFKVLISNSFLITALFRSTWAITILVLHSSDSLYLKLPLIPCPSLLISVRFPALSCLSGTSYESIWHPGPYLRPMMTYSRPTWYALPSLFSDPSSSSHPSSHSDLTFYHNETSLSHILFCPKICNLSKPYKRPLLNRKGIKKTPRTSRVANSDMN